MEKSKLIREAQLIRQRINVNKNAVNLYPAKAVNLLLKVQRKRQSMNDELLNLGIGKSFVDVEYIERIKQADQEEKHT